MTDPLAPSLSKGATLHRAAIVGTGSALPPKVLTNDDLAKLVDTDDEWIRTRTGIRERRIAEGPLPATRLSVEAARNALAAAEMSPEAIDLIVVGTTTADYAGYPATAPLVAKELGCGSCAFGFDLSLACTSFIAALMTAEKFIASGGAETAVVIGVDVNSAILDWTDRNTCVIFGDGAGAAVLRRASPGARGEILHGSIGMTGDAAPLYVDAETRKIKMKGREIFKFAVTTFADEISRAAASVGRTAKDLAAIVPHQVNTRIMEAAAERLGISMDSMVMNIEKYGNTSSGSVPIALDEAARAGRLKAGDLVCLVAFGGGLSWGASLVRW